jgi:hypothetical protein
LNETLHALPDEHQAAVYQALHDRWTSAFFELIAARTLQVLGASLEVEPGGAEDIRIDFVASFPERARRQVEALTLGEVRSYVAPWRRHAPPDQPLLCRQGGEGLEQRQG